jgi:microcystin-dependent protein
MDPYVGELKVFAYDRIPRGWTACEGQLLPVNQNAALYALIGNIYGGNTVNFALPDLRGRVLVGMGASPVSHVPYVIGGNAGKETIALDSSQIPAHNHTVSIKSGLGNNPLVAGNTPAAQPHIGVIANANIETLAVTSAPPANTIVSLNSKTIGTTGGGAGHENRMPYTALQICIAVVGEFPIRG